MKRLRIFVFILILSGVLAPRCWATVYHSDGSAASVQGLLNTVLNGDTITLPAGMFTWASGVTVRKGITLQGVAGATQINRAAAYRSALIAIADLPNDLPVRVTGIRFNSPVGQNGDLYSIAVTGPYGGTWGLTKLRIDHCYFYGGQRTLFFKWRVNGVVDHSTFRDCAPITLYNGDDDNAWTRAGRSPFGTSDSIFFEDNSIVADGALSYFDTQSDQNFGGKFVWRHNNFDVTAYTKDFGSIISVHGNQAYWQGQNDWLRGGIMCEFYDNTVRFGSAFRIIWFRGGRNIVANNAFYGNLGGKLVGFDEEEGINITPLRHSWPAEDQVNNTFVFGNTLNGQAQTDSLIGVWQAASALFIQRGRDYWTRAPSPATVTTYSHPASPSLPNYPLPYNPAITSWRPYTYPHPLVANSTE
jgi:hypothetical protein